MDPIRVALVDDSSAFLAIATRFLTTHKEVEVVGAVTAGNQAVALARDRHPDVILLDLAMPDMPGLKAIPLLRAALPNLRIIVLTVLALDQYRDAALAAGADDFVAKEDITTALLPAILGVTQVIAPRQTPTKGANHSQSPHGVRRPPQGERVEESPDWRRTDPCPAGQAMRLRLDFRSWRPCGRSRGHALRRPHSGQCATPPVLCGRQRLG